MIPSITSEEREHIARGLHEKYAVVAVNPVGQFNYPTGRKGLDALGYDRALTSKLPDEAAAFYCGVGNPFALGQIHPGERVLDVGCGAGVDTILAGIIAGPNGTAVGVDIVPEMIARAESNLKAAAVANVTFQTASGENLPFADNAFDVVISNGAINLIPDKEAALSEIARVLKPAGRLMLADQVAAAAIEKDFKARLANWFQ
jgi:arsenite methyltransferase